jgi:hypothetical protein
MRFVQYVVNLKINADDNRADMYFDNALNSKTLRKYLEFCLEYQISWLSFPFQLS